MRRLTLLCAITVTLSATTNTSELTDNLLVFHQHYDRFIRAYFGCRKEAHSTAECDPHQGSIDYAEFNRARKAAARLFDLELR